MKRTNLLFLLIGLTGVTFASCEKNEPTTPPPPRPDFTRIESTEAVVGYDEAHRIAERAIGILDEGIPASDMRTEERLQGYPYYSEKTRPAGNPEIPLLYVFLNNTARAVIATDRRAGGLLYVIEEQFTQNRTILGASERGAVVNGADLYVGALVPLLEELAAIPNPAAGTDTEKGRLEIRDKMITREVVKPKVTVAWGEDSPYNLYCPVIQGTKAHAGSAATAIAQTMSAYSHPSEMQFTYPMADLSSATLDWPGIRKHFNTPLCDYSCPEHQTTGRIFREIGKQLDMEYDSGQRESWAEFGKLPACLHHFGFTADPTAEYDLDAIRSSLLAGEMVCMTGKSVPPRKTSEKVWVIDGIENVETETEVWFVPDNGGPRVLVDKGRKATRYLHCNWGSDGDCNGYFNFGIFDMDAPAQLDPGSTWDGGYNYTKNLRMVTGIRPGN